MNYSLSKTVDALESWIRNENYNGYDPYDGLRSKYFNFNHKYLKIAFIQFNKRSPVNLRPLFGIDKSLNPKAVALFISAYVRLYKTTGLKKYLLRARYLAEILISRAIRNYRGLCWGYNFDWQSRTFFAPEGTPNVICTTFAGHALLDLYSVDKEQKLLEYTKKICEFLLKDLNIIEYRDTLCFSYTPGDRSRIHNASLLVAEYLYRANEFSKEPEVFDIVNRAVKYSCNRQNQDGSWYYGEDNNQKWIDNFHTGYNLVALKNISDKTNKISFENCIEKGYKYYSENLFLGEIPKYFHNKLYPIDIHSVSQTIITFSRFGDIEKAGEVFKWAIENMRSSKGYFYFQKHRLYTNKIPYIRWAQAWMFYALAYMKEKLNDS